MVSDAVQSPLLALVQRLREVAAPPTPGPADAQGQVDYAAAVHCIESSVLTMSVGECKAMVSDGAVDDIIETAVKSVLQGPLAWVVVESWVSGIDTLLARTTPSTNTSQFVLQLWDGVKRLAKERSSSGGVLAAALKLLRVILSRRPMALECTPRHHLPHPLKTVGVAPRVAALELLPCLILQQRRQPEHQPRQRNVGRPLCKPILSVPFLDYLRKALMCTLPVVREKAIRVICVLLQGGVALEVAQIFPLLEMVMRLVEGTRGDGMPSRLRNDVGVAVGLLLVASQGDSGWSHFAAAAAPASARITNRIFQPDKMTRTMQEILSVAVGTLLLLLATASSQVMDDAVVCVFELLSPVGHDNRSYMPHIVARAVKQWALHMGSDALRGALVTSLTRFLDASCSKTATHTALLCVAHVVRTTVDTTEFETTLWAQLLLVPLRHPTLLQATGDVLTCVAQKSEVCGRVLLRELYTASGDMDANQPMRPIVALYVKALLAMPDTFLQQPSVLQTLLALVTSLSIDVPPSKVEGMFLRRVDYFNRFALLLFTHQRDRLSPVTVANIKTSVRIFLSLLVSNPSNSLLYAHAACSACDLLQTLGADCQEVKLVLALLETMGVTSESVSSPVRTAAYALLSRVPWSNYLDSLGKTVAVTQALTDVEETIRNGVPCTAADGDEEGVLPAFSRASLVAEFLDGPHQLLPTHAQKSQAALARCAVEFIVGACVTCGSEKTGSGEEARGDCLQCVLEKLQEWRIAPGGDYIVTAWNVMFFLDSIFSHCNDVLTVRVVETQVDDWFEFVSTHWLSCGVWAVQIAAAKLLARLALHTGRRDEFTFALVKECNTDAHRLGVIILVLGELHGCGDHHDRSAAATMVGSFVTRVLKQLGFCTDGETEITVVAAALVSMIRMMPQHPELVMSTARTILLSHLLLPTSGAVLHPLVLLLIFELLSHAFLHMYLPDDASLNVSVRGVIIHLAAIAIASTRTTPTTVEAPRVLAMGAYHMLPESAVKLVLSTTCHILEQLAPPAGKGVKFSAPSLYMVDLVVLWRHVLELLKYPCGLSDIASRALASLLGHLCTAVHPRESCTLLTTVASMIDAAASQETRDAWGKTARTILCCAGSQWLGMCLQQMELVMRGKPPQRCAVEEWAVTAAGANAAQDEFAEEENHIGEERSCASWPPSAEAARVTIKSEGDVGMGSAVEVTSEAASKVLVLTLLSEMLQQDSDIFIELDNGSDSRNLALYLHLVFSSAALVEVVPNLVRPAISALQAVVDTWGSRRMSGTLTPFLHPWRVMLANSVQSVVQRAIFCSKAGCVLAESLVECCLVDESNLRRVVEVLVKLLMELESCDADSSAVGHGGCGRVVLALSACRTRAAEAQWQQAVKCALEAIASPSGQAAAAVMCNQLTTSLALMHGFEPTHDMVPTPLDDCMCTTPKSVLSVLRDICCTVPVLGPTLRHAAGCLLCLVICTPRAPLWLMCDIIPLLSVTHQEIVLDAAFGLLFCQGDDALTEVEAVQMLGIAAAAAACGTRDEQVESFLYAMMDQKRHYVGSAVEALLLALRSSCGTDCLIRLLQQFQVDPLLECSESMETVLLCLQENFSEEEHRFMSLSSPCALLLMQRLSNITARRSSSERSENNNNQRQHSFLLPQLLAEPNSAAIALPCMAEVLVRAQNPLLLLQRVFPWLHQSLLACGAILALCVSARHPELQHRWAPCVEHALLSSIHTEKALDEGQSPNTLERVSFFVRSILLLLLLFASSASPSEEVRSRYPGVYTALMQQLMQKHADELKTVIQSLREEEALTLRKFMTHRVKDNSQHPKEHTVERAEASWKSHASIIPQRLSVNVALYTQ